MGFSLTRLVGAAALLTIAAAGCQQSVIGGGNKPALTSFSIVGDPGTPFTALISDTVATWRIDSVVPLTMAVANNTPPIRLIATKTINNRNTLSVEVLSGFTIVQLASTTDPFGTASVQTGGTLVSIPQLAGQDIRFVVKAPIAEQFTALIEDQDKGFIVSGVVPAVVFFEAGQGRIDGNFNQVTNFGNFDVDLVINGNVVANAMGGPSVTVKSP